MCQYVWSTFMNWFNAQERYMAAILIFDPQHQQHPISIPSASPLPPWTLRALRLPSEKKLEGQRALASTSRARGSESNEPYMATEKSGKWWESSGFWGYTVFRSVEHVNEICTCDHHCPFLKRYIWIWKSISLWDTPMCVCIATKRWKAEHLEIMEETSHIHTYPGTLLYLFRGCYIWGGCSIFCGVLEG